MAGRVPGRSRYRAPARLGLHHDQWSVDEVVFAASFRRRLLGIRAHPGRGVLLHARSVHGFGLAEPIRVIHLSRSGTVLAADLLLPGRVMGSWAYWLLELTTAIPAPSTGVELTVLPSSPG